MEGLTSILDLPSDILCLLSSRVYLDVASARNFMLSSIRIYNAIPVKFRFSRLHVNERSSAWLNRVYFAKKDFEGDQCYICMGEKRFCDHATFQNEIHIFLNIPSFSSQGTPLPKLRWVYVRRFLNARFEDWKYFVDQKDVDMIYRKATEYMDKQLGV